MSTDEPKETDGWLTIAEIADELHLTPAAIRLWISKGMLPAKRAGMRKLLVHRYDLDWMLREREAIKARRHVESLESHVDRPSELSTTRRVTAEGVDERATSHELIMFALKGLSEADEDLAAARAASENAPPDPDFAHRVRNLAYAFAEQSGALSRASSMGFSWTPAPPPHRQQPISHELRPGGNRPGPPPLWAAFDRAVDEVAVARAGTDMRGLAVQTEHLANRLHAIADALGERPEESGE